jgi:hypothetical protein
LDGKKRWGAIQRMRQFIKNPSKITKCRQFQCRILQLAQRNVSKSGQEMQPTCISNTTRIHKVVARLVINSFLCLWMVYGNYLHWISYPPLPYGVAAMAPPCSCRCQVAVAVVGHLPYLSAESMGLTVSQPPSVGPSKFNGAWKKRSLKNGMVQWMKLPRKSDGFELFIDLSLSLSIAIPRVSTYICVLFILVIYLSYIHISLYIIYISLSLTLSLSLFGGLSLGPNKTTKPRL